MFVQRTVVAVVLIGGSMYALFRLARADDTPRVRVMQFALVLVLLVGLLTVLDMPAYMSAT
jgi:hypothetical protein